jgi:isoprenylcysteine carboxyl methyltransferase (ICMT) family protein YpbQ
MKPALPKSDTHLGTNLLGFGISLVAIYALSGAGLTALDTAILVVLAAVIPILLIEYFVFKRHREASAALSAKRAFSVTRVAIKYLGLVGILVFFAGLYWLFPEYEKPLYVHAWPFLTVLVVISLVAAPFYFAWCDTRLDQPEDGYYQLGNLLLLRPSDKGMIGRLLRGWLVKAFFLPLMFVYTVQSVEMLQRFSLDENTIALQIITMGFSVVLFGDLLFAVVGYIFTLRIFNSQIRSSEPTVLGWLVAIACYTPFWAALVSTFYLNYDDELIWQNIIPEGNWQILWGLMILALYVIYSLATVCLGVRFSNLTYRGLVTNGPYRFTKHPAYVAKNLSWWMVSLPFISNTGTASAIAMSLALLGVNIIYFIRARTEENHLSNYPEYVAYAEAMNERSIFAPLAKRVPFLIYKKNPSKI